MYFIKKIKQKGILLCLAFAVLYPLLTTGCSTGRYHFDNLPPAFQDKPLKKYIMRQKIWTLVDRFLIKDENDTPLFYVKGKLFSIGDKLSFQDMSGNELAYISQKVLSFTPRYKIYRDNQLIAKVVKKITLFNDKFTVHIPGDEDCKVSGNFWSYEYTFTRSGRPVAFVSKKFFSWSDTYGVAIMPGEDDILILAITVVIDMVSHGDQEHHSSARRVER